RRRADRVAGDRRGRPRARPRRRRAGSLPPRLPSAVAVLQAHRGRARARRRELPRAASVLAFRVRDLPRQLSADELAELFSGRTRFVERLAHEQDPLTRADELIETLPYDEKVEACEAHPRIGERSPEQHGDDPEVLAELAELNRAYEENFGFRFIVFV